MNMKHFSVIVAAIFMATCIGANAQTVKQGSLVPLLGVRSMSVNFDFSNAMVEGMRMTDFLQDVYYGADIAPLTLFEREKKEIVGDFIEEFNDVKFPLNITVAPNAPMRMTVVVKEVNRKGNTVRCDYVICSSNGEQVAVIDMTSKDGRVGSFTNLMGDAFETAGEDLAKFIKTSLKKVRK